MSTRARIAIENEDGTYTSIYTHSDGYPSHHGSILLNHYRHLSTVKELLNLGDCSILEETITSTRAYCRDRGEVYEEVRAKTSESLDDLIKYTDNCCGAYLYVFRKSDSLGWHWCFKQMRCDTELCVLTPDDLRD